MDVVVVRPEYLLLHCRDVVLQGGNVGVQVSQPPFFLQREAGGEVDLWDQYLCKRKPELTHSQCSLQLFDCSLFGFLNSVVQAEGEDDFLHWSCGPGVFQNVFSISEVGSREAVDLQSCDVICGKSVNIRVSNYDAFFFNIEDPIVCLSG